MSHSLPSPSSILLERSSSADARTAALTDVLDRPDETDLLVVSYRDAPDSWLRTLQTRVGDLPSEIGVVNVGVTTRSLATAAPAASPSDSRRRSPSADESLPVDTAVADPTDLASVGVRASEYLDAWEGDGRETVVVLDSVTALLEAVSLDRAFAFLHVLAGRVESVDGRGYYLLDPAAHDDRVLSVVRELADRVVDLDAADGERPTGGN